MLLLWTIIFVKFFFMYGRVSNVFKLRIKARRLSVRSEANNGQNSKKLQMSDTIYYVGSVLCSMIGMSYLAVPMYKLLCSQTGIDGTPMTSKGSKFLPETMFPIEKARKIKITFDASLADTMRWNFVPETRTISVVPGETSLSFYKASNPTNEDIVGISTYRLIMLLIISALCLQKRLSTSTRYNAFASRSRS